MTILAALTTAVAIGWLTPAALDATTLRRRTVRVFLGRADLERDSQFDEVLRASKTFDIVAFSARVLKDYSPVLTEAVASGTAVRVIIADPRPGNRQTYDQVALMCGETPEIKRQEAAQLIDAVKTLRSSVGDGSKGSIELRVLTGLPLFYNLWVAQFRDGTNCAHLSPNLTRKYPQNPSFRECGSGSQFAEVMRGEFAHVWAKSIPWQE
jgi:hypothetical protein